MMQALLVAGDSRRDGRSMERFQCAILLPSWDGSRPPFWKFREVGERSAERLANLEVPSAVVLSLDFSTTVKFLVRRQLSEAPQAFLLESARGTVCRLWIEKVGTTALTLDFKQVPGRDHQNVLLEVMKLSGRVVHSQVLPRSCRVGEMEQRVIDSLCFTAAEAKAISWFLAGVRQPLSPLPRTCSIKKLLAEHREPKQQQLTAVVLREPSAAGPTESADQE